MQKNIIVFFSGTGTNFKYIIDVLHNKVVGGVRFCVSASLCNNPKAKGIDIAKQSKIPCHIIAHKDKLLYEQALMDFMHEQDYDLIVLAGYMKIISPSFLSSLTAPIINLHPSLLPRHKGLNAMRRSFDDEHKEGGVSVHFVSNDLDSGEIIVQKGIQKAGLDFSEYEKRIKKLEHETLLEAILKVLDLEQK